VREGRGHAPISCVTHVHKHINQDQVEERDDFTFYLQLMNPETMTNTLRPTILHPEFKFDPMTLNTDAHERVEDCHG